MPCQVPATMNGSRSLFLMGSLFEFFRCSEERQSCIRETEVLTDCVNWFYVIRVQQGVIGQALFLTLLLSMPFRLDPATRVDLDEIAFT